MSEGHEEPPADVRSFLPRPGEPVEDYAERLRGLHRDLTLVLQAVERGLAAADATGRDPVLDPSDPRGPVPEQVQVQVPVHVPEPEPVGVHATVRGGPRVEVLPPRSGSAVRESGEERRGSAPAPPSFPPRPSAREEDAFDEEPAGPAWVERPEPAAPVLAHAGADQGHWAAQAVGGRLGAARVEADEPPPPPVGRLWVEGHAQPSELARAAAQEAAPARRSLPPLLIALTATGWLVVAALLLALLLD